MSGLLAIPRRTTAEPWSWPVWELSALQQVGFIEDIKVHMRTQKPLVVKYRIG